MSHPLDSAKAKLARGFEHLDQADTEIDAFLAANPYGIRTEYHFEIPQEVLRLPRHVVRLTGPKDPPPHPRLVFADGLQNLRSALDHLVYELADLDPQTPRGEHTQWPIFADPKRFVGRERQYLEGVLPDHRARIRAAQPWDPKYRLLTDLLTLNDRDKHRTLETLVTHARALEIQFDPVIPAKDVRYPIRPTTWMDEGTELFRFASDAKVAMKAKLTYGVAFGIRDGSGLGTRAARELGGVIADILASFEDAFA